jgi:hypothetical protein
MKRGSLQRLTLAIAAATMLLGPATKAISAEISASAFVTNLYGYVQDGDLTAAKEALTQLQNLGIKQFQIAGVYYRIADILMTLDDPAGSKALLAELYASVNSGIKAYFVSENRVVASVNWDAAGGGDLFPTGSAGV